MKWHEVSVYTKVENEYALTQFLNIISKGVSIEYSVDLLKENIDDFDDKFRLNPDEYPDENIRVLVYFDETNNLQDKLKQINQFISDNHSELVEPSSIDIQHTEIEESDWENEWKNYFHSFRVSEHFMIVPSWELNDYNPKEHDKLIKLDPGMAFGTGDHPTTSMCLKFIERLVSKEDKIIDVGTGSGILSIGSHLMGARDIKATDIDDLSLKVARENFELNDCAEDIVLETGDLLKNETAQYDMIIANILAHIIDEMIDDAYQCLKTGGTFIASGIIVEKRDEIIAHLKQAGFEIIEVLEEGGWNAILSKKV
jgi:ribosomal protein L11 methyltransferase